MEILIFVLGIQSGLLAAAAVWIIRQTRQKQAPKEPDKADPIEQQYANMFNYDGTKQSQREIDY